MKKNQIETNDFNNNLQSIEDKNSKNEEEVKLNEIENNNNKNTSVKTKLNDDCNKTGVCLAFNSSNGLYRSMVTFLGAARSLNATHFDKFIDCINKSSLFYCGGFLLTSSFDLVTKIGQYCHENNKKFTLNLSAPYICSNFGNQIAQLIPDLDILFGNEKELREFSNFHNFGVRSF